MTTHINVSDTGLDVIPPRDTLTQGSDNTLLCEFEFSGAWQECTEINAVFTDGINSATAPVTANACVIPVEILQNPWRFVYISLNGSNLGGLITSPFVRLGQVLPSAYGGEGGKFVTMAQLQEILLDYVLRAELGEYVTQETLDAALATYIKASEAQENFDALSSRITANSAAIAANAADIAEKASQAELHALSDAVDGKADESALADYWSKSEIGLQTSGDGKEFLANDGKYYPIQGGTGYDKTFIAEYNVTTAQEIIAYLDASKEPFAPILVKRGGDYYTVTTASKQAADKVIIVTFASLSGNYYTFTYTITGNTWATASYGFQKLLESGANIKTINGQSLLGSGDIQIQGGGGVTPEELAAALADYLKTADAQATYATLAGLQAVQNDVAGKASQADLQALVAVVNGKAAQADVTALQTRVGAAETNITALQNDKADKTQLADYETTAHASATYATQVQVDGKADASTVTALQSDVSANTAAIADNAAAIATKAAQADLEALQTAVNGKADASALADYETAAHAAETYETKADASPIKSISAGGAAVAPDASGNVAITKTVIGNSTSGQKTLVHVREAVSNESYGQELGMSYDFDGTKRTNFNVWQFERVPTPTVPAATCRLVTNDEFDSATNDMATQTWVQEYVASLDGTNIAV